MHVPYVSIPTGISLKKGQDMKHSDQFDNPVIDNDYIAEPESIKAWLREFKDLPPAPPELIEALNNMLGNDGDWCLNPQQNAKHLEIAQKVKQDNEK